MRYSALSLYTRSKVSLRREIILIKSSPDPITRDLATPAPPLPRRSRRANIGIDKGDGEIYTPIVTKYIIKIISFYPLKDNPYIYVKGKGINLTIIIIYIDDFIIVAPSDNNI
ncbi:hypothetical protein N7519_000440 [Penicillium mononematosum]|uniref:uncharacterized protein n=1 Tax=Penicillium mononematosum TaxID=268346 RepID=UPI0025470FE9|nr:uncharacterized protein N7519_000440 [Penicillium mononematosum]KAJ6190419.1 hypothetical protein N7519_000440 [Penicillium mononematosum]